MVDTQPSRSPEDLLAALDAIEGDERADLSAAGISATSARSLLDKQGASYRVLNARFSGNLPGLHEIGVGPATSVLGEFQDALSEIGAVLLESVPRRGPLSAEVLNATELRFSPHVAPGSVIFTLQPMRRDAELWADDAPGILERSLDKLFSVFESIERPNTAGSTPDTVPALLKEFGPRTARHLFKFASALGSDGLSLDLGWIRSGQKDVRSGLSSAGASYLGALAKEATKRDREVVLVGAVHNLGIDNKHRFDDDELGRISLSSSEAVTKQLLEHFQGGRVRVMATETETINVATGISSSTFRAISLVSIGDEPSPGSDESAAEPTNAD